MYQYYIVFTQSSSFFPGQPLRFYSMVKQFAHEPLDTNDLQEIHNEHFEATNMQCTVISWQRLEGSGEVETYQNPVKTGIDVEGLQ